MLLIHKNNKVSDNRVSNLTYNCYNCYFRNYSGDQNILNKVKKDKIISCKSCGYNLSKLSSKCKKLGICKICISKYKPSNINDGLELFGNTFENSLTKEDLIEQQQLESSISIDENINNELLLSMENKELINKSSTNSKKKDIKRNTNNKSKKPKKPSKIDDSLKINIDVNDISLNDINEIQSLMK